MDNIITQNDVLLEFDSLIKEYGYYTVEPNGTSDDTTYIGITINGSNIIAGCVGIKKNVIKQLRVKKLLRGHGYGTSLLHNAENLIRMRKYKSITTYVHFQNKKALTFFNKNNYLLVKRLNYYYILKKV